MKINEIKKDARIKLSGNYIKCCSSSLLYFIIVSLLTFAQANLAGIIHNSILSAIIQAIFIIINWILGYGIIANILDLTDGKTNSITDFINSSLKNFVKYTKIGFCFLLKILFPLIINIFAGFYWIGTMVAKVNNINFLCFNRNLIPLASFVWVLAFLILVYFILRYMLSAYIFHEHPDIAEKDILAKSRKLMHFKKYKYILLLLSFLHWFLLAALIISILSLFIEAKFLTPFMVLFYSMIRPYVIVSKNEFYKELKEEKESKVDKLDDSKKEIIEKK